MAVLVCGGAGYIGSHVVRTLVEAGEEVLVADNLVTGHIEAVHPRAKLYRGDLRDAGFMETLFSENKIDGVIDFAAFSLVGESVLDPLKYFENNFYGTLCLLKHMRDHKVHKIVFSSTAATYGEPENIPILENDRTLPTNPYGESKLSVEKMLKWCEIAHGIKYTVLRYFNVAGAHPSGEIGEDHNPETHLIPIILQTALGKRSKISIYGNDYSTPDGTCIRDYIHVMDLADAHILALRQLYAGQAGGIFNLGNGEGFSVKDVIQVARDVTGHPIPTEICPRRAGDPAKLVSSAEKAIRTLHWSPRFPQLEKIIVSAWNWHRNHPFGYEK
ncbi:MAG: UDP-glucose 4-epimerase GalE [Fusobacteriaceae bacterium]|jgi:UDP-glucose 4-epimerase|nr:UDP-glucose 4-epimerase GalE [Fusobacteriaceae bacterium]